MFWTHLQQLYSTHSPWMFGLFYAIWITSTGAMLLLQRRPPVATLAWLLAFAFVPVLSALAYVLFGPHRLRRRRLKRALAKRWTQEFGHRKNNGAADVMREPSQWAELANMVARYTRHPPRRAQSVTIYNSGAEAYSAIEEAIQGAIHHIHMEYFIWQSDEMGGRWRDLLVERARAGVCVRILLDAIGSKGCNDAFWRPLREAGGEVARFNPINFSHFRPNLLNFRTHRKIVVIDGAIGFTGGINVASQHTHMLSHSRAWRDTHLRLEGWPVQNLQKIFFEDWQYSWPHKLKNIAADYFPTITIADGPWVQLIDSGPDETIPAIHRFLFTAITQARRRVWLTTPYFVPDDALYVALASACARGVDVRLIIPKRGDFWLSSIATRSFAEDVVSEGVSVYLYANRMIHAKTAVIDDHLALIGTANLDNRSFRLNFEVMAAIYDSKITADLAKLFEEDLAHCEMFLPDQLRTPLYLRLASGVARLFAPIL